MSEPMLHLTSAQRRLLCRCLRLRVPGVQVLAYGSRVAGWPGCGPLKRHSDLDLALIGPLPDLALAELRADLDDSDLPWKVDLVRWGDLPPALGAAVLAHGVDLTEAQARADAAAAAVR